MSTIVPADANLIYSPYTWLVSGGVAKTINSGAYLRVAFTGTPATLAATFDVTNQPAAKSRVGFRVDGGSWQDFDIAASLSLTLPTGNTWGSHTVEMIVIATTEGANRWAAPQNTAVVFTGLTADVAVATRPIRTRGVFGLAVGDSITEGVRTLNATSPTDPFRNDSRKAWSHPLGELLGAEIGVVGFGATGIAGGGSGGVPAFQSSAPYLWSGQARDLVSPRKPDFIAAHIGTNDSGATDAAVTAGTTGLLNYWIGATTAPIIVFPGWLQTKAAAILAGIAACSDPSRVTYVDTTGWWNSADSSDGLHPYGYINTTQLAPRAADAIRPLINRPAVAYYRNAVGAAVPLLSI